MIRSQNLNKKRKNHKKRQDAKHYNQIINNVNIT